MNNPEQTVLNELYCFSFVAMSFLTTGKKLSLIEYWSKDKLLCSDIFGEVMTRDRYFTLLGMLHFTHDVGATNDRLCKLRNIINMLRKTFSDSFQLYQQLCIDDSLHLYKGRLSFKHFCKKK